jgi:tetratricopeptide (TPR) repeat protein
MLCAMAAATASYELPPVTTLALVRDDLVEELARAEALVVANRHDEAVEQLEELWEEARDDATLALRQRLALAWSELYRGNLERAGELLAHAEGIAKSPRFDAGDRAEVTFGQGCVAFQKHQVAEAITLLTRSLEANEHAPRPRLLLASNAHDWRSRCYQVRRDWEAAGRDAERSLDLATRLGDELAQGRALFQASLIAARSRDLLMARFYGERALDVFRKHGNTLVTARILNNLGGIDMLLGADTQAEGRLIESISTAADAGSDADLAQAVNSLALLCLRTGRPAEAHIRAERAAELLAGRSDYLDELGSAQLTVARALAAEGDTASAGEWLDAADKSFNTVGSTSHRAAALVARGDLIRTLGDVDTAADYYRRAAESLQDVQF